MESVAFYVGDRLQVYWDWNLSKKNIRFLNGVDAKHYNHVVQAHSPYLEGDGKLYAAAALRIAYAQGLEALFALLCATVQAPKCVIGWMHSYQNEELKKTVKKISSGASIQTVPLFYSANWNSLAKLVHSDLDVNETRSAWIQEGFGSLWTSYATDFLDDSRTREYHALKHGSRPCLGGFHLAFGRQPDRNTPAPPEAMQSLGGSEFGSTFFIEERIGNNKLHCRPRSVSMNWVPENIIYGIEMIATSIQNVLSFLKILNGIPPAECQFAFPVDENGFDRPWAKCCGVISSSMDTTIGVKDIQPWTKEELIRSINFSA